MENGKIWENPRFSIFDCFEKNSEKPETFARKVKRAPAIFLAGTVFRIS